MNLNERNDELQKMGIADDALVKWKVGIGKVELN